MADISTLDNFFDKFPPKSGFQTKRRNMALKRHKGTSKRSEIASEVKPESKYLFNALLSLMAHSDMSTSYVSCSRFCTFVRNLVNVRKSHLRKFYLVGKNVINRQFFKLQSGEVTFT